VSGGQVNRAALAVGLTGIVVILGVANLATGLFQGFAISSSASRTPVAVAAGARSQLTPLVGAVTLRQLLDELRQEQVPLAFAELKGPVKDRLHRYGLFEAVGPDRFFPTIGTAADAYIDATGTTWVDWEERPDPAGPVPSSDVPG
jgi:MFS superfamily sulfate permease-like transporter